MQRATLTRFFRIKKTFNIIMLYRNFVLLKETEETWD